MKLSDSTVALVVVTIAILIASTIIILFDDGVQADHLTVLFAVIVPVIAALIKANETNKTMKDVSENVKQVSRQVNGSMSDLHDRMDSVENRVK